MFAMEARGELAPGTSRAWAYESPPYEALPEAVAGELVTVARSPNDRTIRPWAAFAALLAALAGAVFGIRARQRR